MDYVIPGLNGYIQGKGFTNVQIIIELLLLFIYSHVITDLDKFKLIYILATESFYWTESNDFFI